MDELYPTGPIRNLMKQMSNLEHFREEKQDLFNSLTEREIEVLTYVAIGMKNPEIADKLDITRVTVQNHRARIREKLNVQNQAEFVKYAMAFNLIEF